MEAHWILCFISKIFKDKRTRRKENERVKEENGGKRENEEKVTERGWNEQKRKKGALLNCENLIQIHCVTRSFKAHGSNNNSALNSNRSLVI